jgi:hypothetical protein
MPASSIAGSTSYTTDDWLRAAIAAATTSMLQPTRPLWNRRQVCLSITKQQARMLAACTKADEQRKANAANLEEQAGCLLCSLAALLCLWVGTR